MKNWIVAIAIAGLFGVVSAHADAGCSNKQLSRAGKAALKDPIVWAKIQKSGGLPETSPNRWAFGEVMSADEHVNSRTGVTSTAYSVAFYNERDQDYSLNVIITALDGCKIVHTWVDVSSIDGG